MATYELPRLPYGYDGLEPFTSAEALRVHHRVFHQECVDGLNRALGGIGGLSHPKHISAILSDLGSVPREAQDAIRFFGGGFENHRMFWDEMSPDGGGSPGGGLGDAIEVYFDGFESFKDAFSQQASSMEGSGWCWLAFNPTYCRIEITATPGNDTPWMFQRTPLLGLDVWEHSYQPGYAESIPDYVDAWWDVVNWDYVENRFSGLI